MFQQHTCTRVSPLSQRAHPGNKLESNSNTGQLKGSPGPQKSKFQINTAWQPILSSFHSYQATYPDQFSGNHRQPQHTGQFLRHIRLRQALGSVLLFMSSHATIFSQSIDTSHFRFNTSHISMNTIQNHFKKQAQGKWDWGHNHYKSKLGQKG